MLFSEESRFYLDNIDLVKETFQFGVYSHIYFTRFLLNFKILPPSQFRDLMRKISSQGGYEEEVKFIAEDFIPSLLYREDFRNRRLTLVALSYYTTRFFGIAEAEFENNLHLW